MQGAFQVFLRYAMGQVGANLGLIRKDPEALATVPAARFGRQSRAHAALAVIQDAVAGVRG
jgi:hypothetical protein